MKTKRKQMELMRPSEAAKALGVTRNTIMTRIARGMYRSETVSGVTFVSRADIEAAQGPPDMQAA